MPKVTDPALLQELNGGQQPSQPTQPAPAQGGAYPGVIPGVPEAPDRKEKRDVFEDERDFSTSRGDKYFEQTSKLRGEFGSLDFVQEYPTVARQYAFGLQTQPNPSGDQALIVAYAKMLDPASVVREAEFDTTAAADSAIGRTVARIKRELGWEGGGRLSPEAREKVRTEMRTLVQQYDTQYQEARERFSGLANSYGFDPELIVGQDYSQTYSDVINDYWNDPQTQEAPADGSQPFRGDYMTAGADGTAPEGQALLGFGTDNGREFPVFGEPGSDSSGLRQPTEAERNKFDPKWRARGLADRTEEALGEAGYQDLSRQGATLGLSDEAAGVGQALSGVFSGNFNIGENYRLGRDAERIMLDRARERTGGTGTAVEVASGGASILGKAGQVMSAGRAARAAGQPITRANVQGQMARQAGRDGAVAGAVGGYGYGEGLEGSTVNALGGAVLGGGLGYGAQRAGNAIANRSAARGETAADAQALVRAGEAEGVTVNRAMADPNVENRITGVDTSMQGPRLRQGMDEIEGQIEGRVIAQGGSRSTADKEAIGARTQDALDTYREASRVSRNNLYDKAYDAADGVTVTPTRALKAIDEQIADLQASGSNANRGQIRYLQDIREDLARDGGLSIRALRDQRTGMRGQINERNLTATDAERRVGEVLDAASQDIRAGLAGNTKALRLFDRADEAHGQRADFIRQVMRQLTGPENNRVSGTATANKLESWMKSDPVRFQRMWNELADDDRAELRSFIATSLGRDGNGAFSAQRFFSAVSGDKRTVSDRTLRAVFGDEGFQSIRNLRTLSEQVGRVKGQYNHSNTARGNNYRAWLTDTILPGGITGGVGFIAGGGSTGVMTAVGGTAAAAGVKAGRDLLSARMLLNPRITKWIATAPRTQSPAAIDKHFGRLGDIAKAEPALAGEIETLRKAILGAANDNAAAGTGLAAEDKNAEER